MKVVKHTLLTITFSICAAILFAQATPVVTKVEKFKPPVVTTTLGIIENGASVTADEASQLVGLPLKITDGKKNVYKIDSYQFLYRKKSFIQNEETGKVQSTFTIQSARFDSSPFPKIWMDNLQNGFQKDEQLYFFDIVVIDREGRRFFAPELKITIK